MTGFAEGGIFLAMWLGYLSIMIVAICAVLLWGIRSGQFAHQDRARYLPLQSGIPRKGEDK